MPTPHSPKKIQDKTLKKKSEYKSFDNARPITKTSPIYKLLDTIINDKLNKELIDEEGKFKLDKN